MTQNGCLAFFGYDDPFYNVLDFSEVFWECDSEIDRAFAEVDNAGEVYDRLTQLYQQRIQEYKDMWVKAIANGDEREKVSLLYDVVNHLKGNYNHLCCPSVDPRWGRVDIRLSPPASWSKLSASCGKLYNKVTNCLSWVTARIKTY